MTEAIEDMQQPLDAILAEFEANRHRLCEQLASSGLAAAHLNEPSESASPHLETLCQGGKVENSVLLRDGKIELLTGTPDLPVVSMQAGDRAVQSAGVLIR